MIELDSHYYLVEMTWWQNAIGRKDLAGHLVNIANRGGEVRGLFISFSSYSEPAIIDCYNALNRSIIIVLAALDQIFRLLEAEGDLKNGLKQRQKLPYLKKNRL